MTTTHIPIVLSPFHLKLNRFCVWVENLFECRLARFSFAFRTILAGLSLFILIYAQRNWLADAAWPFWAVTWALFGWTVFWGILQIVRRFHDLGRSGGLFWALAVPYWVLWKMIGLFPALWIVWVVVLGGWSIVLTLRLFFQRGVEGLSGYEPR